MPGHLSPRDRLPPSDDSVRATVTALSFERGLGPALANAVQIENIEAMRRREGIDDVELREDIDALAVGDFVRLTLLPREPSAAGETLLVRITSISGPSFRGSLADRPASKGLVELPTEAPLVFTAAHIHSLPKGRPAHGH